MRLVVGIDDEVTAAGLVAGRGEPSHHEVDNLRAEVLAFVLDIDAKLGKQDGGVIDKSLLVVYLATNLLLAGIGQSLSEDAGIGYGESGNNVRRTVRQTEIVSLTEEFVLIILCLVVEEIIDRLPTAVESLNIQIWCTLRHELEIYDVHIHAPFLAMPKLKQVSLWSFGLSKTFISAGWVNVLSSLYIHPQIHRATQSRADALRCTRTAR